MVGRSESLMKYSRRDFLMMGSAASTLWLTGCGGGGSADGMPTAKASVCTADPIPAYVDPSFQINFSNAVALPNADLPFISYWDSARVSVPMFGCTNQLVENVEGSNQELFISVVQVLTAAQTCTTSLIRTLRLHLSMHHDYVPTATTGHSITGSDPSVPNDPNAQYAYGDPTNPGVGQRFFNGELIVTAPTGADGANSWAYQITGGTVQIGSGYNGVQAPLTLTNVVATAAAAGGGNNAAFNAGGRVQMDGSVIVFFDALNGFVSQRTT